MIADAGMIRSPSRGDSCGESMARVLVGVCGSSGVCVLTATIGSTAKARMVCIVSSIEEPRISPRESSGSAFVLEEINVSLVRVTGGVSMRTGTVGSMVGAPSRPKEERAMQ